MGMEVHIGGGADLYAVSRALKGIGAQGLGKQMAKGLQDAAKDLRPAIRASAQQLMPHAGGYAATLSKSLRFRQAVQTSATTARVTFRVHADGRRDRRDVPGLNRGRLRKPLFGNRNRWYNQQVRPGFVDRPVDRLAPEISRRMQAVVDHVADQIGA